MKYVKIILPIAILLATGFYFFRQYSRDEIAQPRVGKVVESIYGLGTVMADQVFRVKVGVALQLRELYAREGDQVKAGQLLARFDESVVKAPFAGTITEISFKEGEIVPPQVPVLTITNLNKIYIEVNLEQQSVLRIRPGQLAIVSFESLRSETARGRVAAVYPRETQFILRIELDSWPKGVLPGMTSDVAIEIGTKEGALLIPLSAISAGKITRVRNGKKEKIDVALGMVDNLWAEVVSGDLKPDDSLVVKGR